MDQSWVHKSQPGMTEQFFKTEVHREAVGLRFMGYKVNQETWHEKHRSSSTKTMLATF